MYSNKQVVPVKVSITLKEKGYPQGESLFMWAKQEDGNFALICREYIDLYFIREKIEESIKKGEVFDAPTLLELDESLLGLMLIKADEWIEKHKE